MKFAEIIDRLNNGELFTRKKWEDRMLIAKQIPQEIPANVVPRMTSLPDAAKERLLGIHYHDQVLIIAMPKEEGAALATSYTPLWEDIFADDWVEA
ncbi:MW1434 family type I TA system toxin [Alistipes sp.]|uniref:Thoeris anti-defense Tad2 family protein n=1 Tax=Alistipes sp. TaxID=1872444 RepID=UPI003529BD2E